MMLDEIQSSKTPGSPSLRWLVVLRLYDVVTVIPWLCLISYGLFVLLALIQYGRWPSALNPDPADAPAGWLFVPLLGYLILLMILTCPAWLVVTVLAIFESIPLRFTWRRALFYAVAIGVCLVLAFRTNTLTWLMSANNYAGGAF